MRAGNVVRPLIDGAPAFRRICEAIDAAEHSVWLTVTFMWSTFEVPDGRGSALDVLDRAASRGIDVRIIFWRPDVVTTGHARNAFWGAAEHRALLDRRRSGVKVRWDRAHRGFCQHQKTWMIDAGGERVSRLRVASISTPTRWLFLATAESESITMCTSRYLARRRSMPTTTLSGDGTR